MAQLKITATNGNDIHEGNSKHYSATLLTFQYEDNETESSLSVTIRAYGSIGKASRHSIEAVNGTDSAVREFSKLLNEKQKRGYTNISLGQKILLTTTIDLEGVKSFDEIIATSGYFGGFFTGCEVTANTKQHETLHKILSKESVQFLSVEIEKLVGLKVRMADLDAMEMKHRVEEFKKSTLALQEKRAENYGTAWGSW